MCKPWIKWDQLTIDMRYIKCKTGWKTGDCPAQPAVTRSEVLVKERALVYFWKTCVPWPRWCLLWTETPLGAAFRHCSGICCGLSKPLHVTGLFDSWNWFHGPESQQLMLAAWPRSGERRSALRAPQMDFTREWWGPRFQVQWSMFLALSQIIH